MKSNQWTEELQQKAQKMLDEGCSWSAIARELNVSRGTIRYHLMPGYKKGREAYNKENRDERREKDRDRVKAYNEKYTRENKEQIRAQQLGYREERRELIKEKMREYNARPSSKERMRNWREENREVIQAKVTEYHRNRRHNDAEFHLQSVLRGRIRRAIVNQFGKKAFKTMELLGCTTSEAREHLEAQFLPGMTWENFGYRGWQIDHIRPCDSFDLTDPEQQKQCFHYTNLQPLWASDNRQKSNKWENPE